MHPDDLNKIWVCHECKSISIYHADKELHAETKGHRRFTVFDIASGRMIKNEKSKATGEFTTSITWTQKEARARMIAT
jgi:hypothetical protein